jgi:hypothetical protein
MVRAMTSYPRFFTVLFLLSACGDDSTPGVDAGRTDAGRSDGGATRDAGGRDGGGAEDAGTTSDAGETTDAGATDAGSDAGMDEDAGCLPPPCPAPPMGCRYEMAGPCDCGVLVCEGGPCGAVTCGPREYCDYTEPYACGGDGVCMPRPEACLDIYRPVCGCDGVTHSNSCYAAGAGTDYAAEGECAPPPPPADCRTIPCPARSHCELCRGMVYACIPDGAMC